MKFTPTVRLIPAVLVLNASGQALAQSTPQTKEQNTEIHEFAEVQVNATKITSSEQDASRSISQTDLSQARHQGNQGTPEALSHESNISQTGGPRSATKSINIRGLQGDKVLQLIDGVPVRFQSGHRASYFLDPALVKSIEVVKGPVSSVWGSGAIAGVVAQSTIDPIDVLKSGEDAGGFVKLSRNANNEQNDVLLGLAYSQDQFDGLLATYYKDGDDLKLGSGDALEDSAERSKGLLLKQNWYFTDQQSIGLSYRNEEVNGQVPNNASAPVNGTSVFPIRRDQSTQDAAFRYQFASLDGVHDLSATASWGSVEIDEQRVSDQRSDQTEQDTYGLSIDHIMRLNGFELLVGAQGEDVSYDGQRGGTAGTRPVPPDATIERRGVYGQVNMPLFSGLTAELGARYDDYSAEAKNLNSKTSDDEVSVSSALVWRTDTGKKGDELTLALRRDEAFRAPSAEELYTTGTHFCMGPGFCNTFQPNPNLKSERAENIELIAKWRAKDLLGADQLSFKGSVFQNKVDDFIEQIVTAPDFTSFPPDAGTTSYVNVDKAELNGFELEAGYHLNGYTTTVKYGQVRGKDKASGEDLTNIPADTITAELAKSFSEHTALGFRASHTQDQDKTRYSANTSGTVYDDYTTLDVFGSWVPSSAPDLQLNLNVKNLTDRNHRETWSQLDATGREIILSSTYRF
jgi:hemoglobin/transferrin/lactoferrin receptor protein